jgi:hypothetical protein
MQINVPAKAAAILRTALRLTGMERTMAMTSGEFSATDLRRRMAEREAERAAEQDRHRNEEEARRKAVYDEFLKPAARSGEQIMALVTQLVRRAAENGASEVQVYQFPSGICLDRGRMINNSTPGWPTSLTGRPLLAFEFWKEQLQPLGFGLKAQILDYPGGFPGDVGLFLTW